MNHINPSYKEALLATCLGGKIYVDTNYIAGYRLIIELPQQEKA